MNSIDIANTLLIKLRNGKVGFAYRTKGGRTRFALGTLKPRYTPNNYVEGKPLQVVTSYTDCVTYWDLQKKGWRRCCVGNILFII